jgi:hypothetical protein
MHVFLALSEENPLRVLPLVLPLHRCQRGSGCGAVRCPWVLALVGQACGRVLSITPCRCCSRQGVGLARSRRGASSAWMPARPLSTPRLRCAQAVAAQCSLLAVATRNAAFLLFQLASLWTERRWSDVTKSPSPRLSPRRLPGGEHFFHRPQECAGVPLCVCFYKRDVRAILT